MDNIIVFYDTQNIAKLDYFDKVKALIEKHGIIASVRIYHDFDTKVNQWKRLCYDNGYFPCQIMRPKKNTADLMITIDAMRLSREDNRNIYCFVTNDSDFGPVSLHLREQGLTTMLISTSNDKVLKSYYSICQTLTVDSATKKESYKPVVVSAVGGKVEIIEPKVEIGEDSKPKPLDKKTVEVYAKKLYNSSKKDEEKWATFSAFCNALAKKFKNINYPELGFKSKKEFLINVGFEIQGSNIRLKK